MATQFFYHDPLDSPNSGGSFMRCEATYETKRTGPTTVELTVNTKFVAKKSSTSYREYDINYDNNREGKSDTLWEKLVAGKEYNFSQTFTYTVGKQSGKISFWYYAFYFKGGSAGNDSGYDATFEAWYPAYVTVAIPTKPVISNIRSDQFSFSWELTDDGGEYPTIHTEIYNHPDYPDQWKALDEIGDYGYINSGTVKDLNRYTKYKIRAYVVNSAGGNRSDEVSLFTLPENPSFSGIIFSDLKTESVKYTWSVTDNGGKEITQYKLQIVNSIQYPEWTDYAISADTTACSGTIKNLYHNTLYEVRMYATNGLSEAYSSSYEFTTLGDPPVITEFRAQSITSNEITIMYSADYDRNAAFKNYFIEYREFGDSNWIKVPDQKRIISGLKSAQHYEFRITVSDNWDRKVTSNIIDIYTYSDIFEKLNPPVVTISGNNVTVTEDFSLIDKDNIRIKNNMICMNIRYGTIKTMIPLKIMSSNNDNQSITFDCTLDETYIHPYKEYEFFYYLSDELGNSFSSESTVFKLNNDHNTTNLIKSDGTINSVDLNTLNSYGQEQSELTFKRLVNYRDVVKLSNNIQYIMVGSSGIKSGVLENAIPFYISTKHIYISGILNLTFVSNKIIGVNFSNIFYKSLDNETYNNSNYSFKFKILSNALSNECSYLVSPGDITNYISNVPQITNINYLAINTNNVKNISELKFKIQVQPGRLYNSTDNEIYETEIISVKEILNELQEQYYFCNSLVELDVYDKSGLNVSSGKFLTSNQKKDVISVNSGSVTDNDHINQSKYVRTYGADTFVLDLGQEYEVSKLDIWRKWNDVKIETDVIDSSQHESNYRDSWTGQDNQCIYVSKFPIDLSKLTVGRKLICEFDIEWKNLVFNTNPPTGVIQFRYYNETGSENSWETHFFKKYISALNISPIITSDNSLVYKVTSEITQDIIDWITANNYNMLRPQIRLNYVDSGILKVNKFKIGYEDETFNSLSQESFIYQDEFVYGLNKDKEICYKFYDYRSNRNPEEPWTKDGREFLIDDISNLENMPHP